MKRTNLVNFSTLRVTPDLNVALSSLLEKAKQYDVIIDIAPNNKNYKNPYSLFQSGREVSLKYSQKNSLILNPDQKIALIWSLSIPLGFTPLQRYPLPGAEADVFHYFGPWQKLYDHLISEGRGEFAWANVCTAALSDLGLYEGEKQIEVFVQAQLHRLGLNCGRIDGIIGERTLKCLKSLGYTNKPLLDVANDLIAREPLLEKSHQDERKIKVSIPKELNCSSSYQGKIQQVKNNFGFEYNISGNGKIVIDIG